MLGFSVALRPDVLWYGFLGCLVGTLVGVLPGIGPLSGISILLPVTFGLNATQAVIMLAGIYYGSQYGGFPPPVPIPLSRRGAAVLTFLGRHTHGHRGPSRGPPLLPPARP